MRQPSALRLLFELLLILVCPCVSHTHTNARHRVCAPLTISITTQVVHVESRPSIGIASVDRVWPRAIGAPPKTHRLIKRGIAERGNEPGDGAGGDTTDGS